VIIYQYKKNARSCVKDINSSFHGTIGYVAPSLHTISKVGGINKVGSGKTRRLVVME
jgi:hypothetical protein